MNKNMLIALALTAATLFAFNYFNQKQDSSVQVGSIPTDVRPGQAYRVPTAQDLAKPLNSDVDFIDKKITQKEEIKDFETDLYNVSFSNYGGVISDLSFKKFLGKEGTPLRTIHHKSFYEREEASFLLALEDKTPYYYDLVDTKDLDDYLQVTYQSKSDNWLIKKIYKLYKNSYKVDLSFKFESNNKSTDPIKPRLFFAAPFIGEIANDLQEGFSLNVNKKSVEKIIERNFNQAWISPEIFGSQDRYFAHGLVSDYQGFTQRAFYKKVNNKLFTVLEGPQFNENTSWDMSFYLGPKIIEDLADVDERLEGLLSFGWLSWLCKFFLKLLALIYSYIGNFGFGIIILAIILKLPFVPLTIWGRKKMEAYQKHQPNINRIRMKYKQDVRRQQEEIMKYHKDHNLSPSSMMAGCLPMLIQMPILFALYRVLGDYLGFYQAPFFGWITDLSAKDPCYILPILMGATMIWQQMLAPVADQKQKVTMIFLPVIFTALFINFPAGLVLYYLMNNLLAVGEDYLRKSFFS